MNMLYIVGRSIRTVRAHPLGIPCVLETTQEELDAGHCESVFCTIQDCPDERGMRIAALLARSFNEGGL